jgi:hypothetical protein
VRSRCRQPARARLRKTAGGQVGNLPLLVRPGGRLETCPSWCGVGRLETCPYRCGNGREGEGGDAIPPSSPRGGEEGEQGKSEGRRRQPARARLRKTAGGQVRNLPLLVRPGGRLETCPSWYGRGAGWKPAPPGTAGGQVGNLPLLVREREGRRGGQGEGEGHQACSAAQALKPLNPCVSAKRRRMRYRSRIKAR